MNWFGWIWFDGRWERVCEGDSLAECSARLGEAGRRRNLPCKHQVMTGGACPTFVPRDATQANPCDANSISVEAGDNP